MMKKRIEKIVNIALNILIGIFGIVLLISVYNTIQIKVFKNSYSNFFGYSVFEIQTNSMADEIFADDWIIVKITKSANVNDVVTFDNGGKFITHRVVEKYNETYVTKGDANNTKDDPIDQSQIVGKVVKILSNFGVYRKTLFDKQVLLALIGALFIISFLFKKDKNEEKEEVQEEQIDNTNVYSFYDEKDKKSIFDKIKKTETTKMNEGKIEVELDQEYLNKQEEKKLYETKEIGSNLEEIENNLKDNELKTVKNIEEANNLESNEEEIEKQENLNIISVDLDHVENIQEEFKEPETIEEEIKEEFKDEEPHDISIITVEIEPIKNDYIETEVVEEKKTLSIEEDPYKSINQEINIEVQELETIEQNNIDSITVYENEIENTKQEIEMYKERILDINNQKEEINENNKQRKLDEIKKEEEQIRLEKEQTEEAKKLTHISLENLTKRKKKSKNIIDKLMITKSDKLESFINILNEHNNLQTNEPSIIEGFCETYNDTLFYNYYLDETSKKIDAQLKTKAELLVKQYKGNDKKFEEKVNKFLEYFLLIAKLETTNLSKKTTKEKNEFYKNELAKYSKNKEWSKEMIPYLITEYKSIQKNHFEKIEYIMKNLETNTFNLELKNLHTDKNMFAVNLEHNVEFDKFYSDFIINETYNNGIIKEDKMNVVISLLMTELVKDMLLGNFTKKYLLYFPKTLYSKKSKLTTMIKTFDDKYAKENIIITLSYDTLLKSRKQIREFRKQGFKFAVCIDGLDEIKEQNKKLFGLLDIIFIDKDNKDKIIKNIPKDYFERIILENITEKLDDYEKRGEV